MHAQLTADSRARVLAVDPRPTHRAGLVDAIERRPDLEVISEAADGSNASDLITRLGPDVVVIDLHVLGFDGLTLLERIIQDESRTRVLILAGRRDRSVVYQAVEAGAAGGLLRDADPEDICNAIAAVAGGAIAFAPQVVDMIVEQVRGRRRGGGGTLTERERAILRLTADGLAAAQVATELAVSESTVKTHLTHIYTKLGVSGAAAAVYEAMRLMILY